MPDLVDSHYYCRGRTRIHFRRHADGLFWLKVNDGEPTPMTPKEVSSWLYDVFVHLKAAGIELAPFHETR